MVYLILAAGAAFALIALYRFFCKASPREVKATLLAAAALGIALAALFLSVTGRLPAALAILAALWPLAAAWLRNRAPSAAAPAQRPGPMTEKEAYDVLGLPFGAKEADIRAAHLRLMKKLHPDQAGSGWLAQKINAARDLLLQR